MKTCNLLWSVYFLGILVPCTLSCLFQDFLGKEKYLKLVNDHWIDLPWWPWAILFVILMRALMSFIRKAAKIDRENSGPPSFD